LPDLEDKSEIIRRSNFWPSTFKRPHHKTPLGQSWNFFFYSAGVGRTGTFIAIDFLLETITANNSINIYELVSYLRHQRAYFVQTWVCSFLHECMKIEGEQQVELPSG
jgi:protein tyrosine phosphatase